MLFYRIEADCLTNPPRSCAPSVHGDAWEDGAVEEFTCLAPVARLAELCELAEPAERGV
jgi:hypothetical protein